jgi:uncharacterized protein
MTGAPAGPVPQPERIASLDVLRGVAVLGILVMNIQSFSMPGVAYINPTAYGDLQGANYWVWYLSHLLTDQKFMTIFSMLFGAGIILMTSRAEATGRGSAGVHYRRMAWLLLFGLLHAHLLWYGDILYFYAVCGFVVYLFRRLPPGWLLGFGLLSAAVASGISLLFGWSMRYWPEAQVASFTAENWQPPAEALERALAVYRGSWLDQMRLRGRDAIFFETFLLVFGVAWRAGGMMLIGMGLFKLGVFSARRSAIFYGALLGLGALVGLPVVGYGVHLNEASGWDVRWSFFFGSQFNYWASILVALGWVGLVMLLCRSGALRAVRRVLAAVGQMALTNYLMQTIICSTIFYGHGFGQFGAFERTGQLATVLAVWAVQLTWSPLWLRWFRFGPFEWLWRSLTYLRLQPMLRK